MKPRDVVEAWEKHSINANIPALTAYDSDRATATALLSPGLSNCSGADAEFVRTSANALMIFQKYSRPYERKSFAVQSCLPSIRFGWGSWKNAVHYANDSAASAQWRPRPPLTCGPHTGAPVGNRHFGAGSQKTSRGCQTRRGVHIACERRSIGCFPDMPAMSGPVMIDPA